MGATLKCGTCRSFLTPPLGVELEGTFARRKASGVLSDLEVNTVVLDDGAAELAFLSVDVCVIEDAVVEELLSRIHDASGIPKHCIFITATHTHSAPTLGSGLFDAAEPDVLYIALAKKIIVSSVVRAQSAKHPVTMTAGQSKNADYQFNRRLHRPDGSIIANFVKDPLIAQAVSSGETDPALFVAKLTDENGKAVALFVNYGQHNNAVSCTLIRYGRRDALDFAPRLRRGDRHPFCHGSRRRRQLDRPHQSRLGRAGQLARFRPVARGQRFAGRRRVQAGRCRTYYR